MRAYGLPVLQSAASTTIVVIPFLPSSSYILQSFSKIVIATVSLGVVHGLLVLPTFLAVCYNRQNIVGPVKAFVSAMKGGLMIIRRRIVQSADVMDSGSLGVGTFRCLFYYFLLLCAQLISPMIPGPSYLADCWRAKTASYQKKMHRQPRVKKEKKLRCHNRQCMIVRNWHVSFRTPHIRLDYILFS